MTFEDKEIDEDLPKHEGINALNRRENTKIWKHDSIKIKGIKVWDKLMSVLKKYEGKSVDLAYSEWREYCGNAELHIVRLFKDQFVNVYDGTSEKNKCYSKYFLTPDGRIIRKKSKKRKTFKFEDKHFSKKSRKFKKLHAEKKQSLYVSEKASESDKKENLDTLIPKLFSAHSYAEKLKEMNRE